MADRRQHKRTGRGRRAQRLGERVAEDGGWGTIVRPRLVNSRPASLFLGWETSGGSSASGARSGPRVVGHSPQAGEVHSSHGTWAGAAGWPQEPEQSGETRKAG